MGPELYCDAWLLYLLQICKFGGAVILAACLKAANTQTFENATGALWNCGLDAANSAVLAASGVPSYLSKPVPEHWILVGGCVASVISANSSGMYIVMYQWR
jgi:hypothetical protein